MGCPGFNSQFGTFLSVGTFVHLSTQCDGKWQGATAVSLHILPGSFKNYFPTFSGLEQPLAGQGVLTIEVSRSQSDTPHSVGLPCTSDQPDAETCQHTTLTRNTSMVPAGFERAILASERAQTHGLYLTATGIGTFPFYVT